MSDKPQGFNQPRPSREVGLATRQVKTLTDLAVCLPGDAFQLLRPPADRVCRQQKGSGRSVQMLRVVSLLDAGAFDGASRGNLDRRRLFGVPGGVGPLQNWSDLGRTFRHVDRIAQGRSGQLGRPISRRGPRIHLGACLPSRRHGHLRQRVLLGRVILSGKRRRDNAWGVTRRP